jgi:hypothetical protein
MDKFSFFRGRKKIRYIPNTFIGTNGNLVFSNAFELANRCDDIIESDIENFSLDNNNNVSCHIKKSYVPRMGFSNIGNVLRYYIDVDNLINITGHAGFQVQSLHTVKMEALTQVDAFSFQRSSITYFDFPNLTSILEGAFYQSYGLNSKMRFPLVTSLPFQAFRLGKMKRIYIPRCVSYGDSPSTNDEVFRDMIRNICTIYIDPSMLTVNNGGLEADLAYAESDRRATIIPVYNFTEPDNINNLSAGSITNSSVVLNFTPPNSLNALDFYEVWIDDGTNDVNLIYKPFSEIQTAGDTLSGLLSETDYIVKITACDIYYNRSDFSNEITFKTSI